jgi:hypothetical protein
MELDGASRLTQCCRVAKCALRKNQLRLLNALLDVITSNFNMPLCLKQLEFISPTDGEVLLLQTLLPIKDGIAAGPLGGVVHPLLTHRPSASLSPIKSADAPQIGKRREQYRDE